MKPAVGEAGHAEASGDRRSPPPPPSPRTRADRRRPRLPTSRGSPRARPVHSSPSRAGRASGRARPRPRARSPGARAPGPTCRPGPPVIESTSGSGSRPAPRGRGDRGADRPRRPRDPDALARDALQRALPRRAVAGEPPGPARTAARDASSTGPRARRAQRDDAPSPERAAVDVRLAALERPGFARERKAPQRREPGARDRARHGAVAPLRRTARADLPVDEIRPVREPDGQMVAGSEIARRPARGRHDPQRLLASERLALLVDAEEGHAARRPATSSAPSRSPRGARVRAPLRHSRRRRGRRARSGSRSRGPGRCRTRCASRPATTRRPRPTSRRG